MRRTLGLWSVLLLFALILTACGAGGRAKEQAQTGAPSMADRETPAASPAPARGAEGAPAESPAEPGGSPAPANRKIILNAEFHVQVKNADDAITSISQAARSAGGYVQETRQSGTKQQGRTVNMTLRVPSGQYGSLTDLVRSQGEVTQQREWTDDVTEQYVDLEVRISNKQTHLKQLRALYDQTASLKDLMELEREIAQVTAELESLQGRMRVLADQVAFSTIHVSLYEPGVPAPIRPPETVWERMKQGFTGSWNGVVNFTGNLAVFLAALVPVLFYLAILGGAGYAIYRAVRRIRRRPPPPPPQA